jgi:hypothetical protein
MVGLLNFLWLVRDFNYSQKGAEGELELVEIKALFILLNRAFLVQNSLI